jgi:hypothetical protein
VPYMYASMCVPCVGDNHTAGGSPCLTAPSASLSLPPPPPTSLTQDTEWFENKRSKRPAGDGMPSLGNTPGSSRPSSNPRGRATPRSASGNALAAAAAAGAAGGVLGLGVPSEFSVLATIGDGDEDAADPGPKPLDGEKWGGPTVCGCVWVCVCGGGGGGHGGCLKTAGVSRVPHLRHNHHKSSPPSLNNTPRSCTHDSVQPCPRKLTCQPSTCSPSS